MAVKYLLVLVWDAKANSFVEGNYQDTRSKLTLQLYRSNIGGAIDICSSRTADLYI